MKAFFRLIKLLCAQFFNYYFLKERLSAHGLQAVEYYKKVFFEGYEPTCGLEDEFEKTLLGMIEVRKQEINEQTRRENSAILLGEMFKNMNPFYFIKVVVRGKR